MSLRRLVAIQSTTFSVMSLPRFEPSDAPQAQIVGLMRSLFGERVLTASMLKSTAISDAALRSRRFMRSAGKTSHAQLYDRAVEALDSVHAEIEKLVRESWAASNEQKTRCPQGDDGADCP